MDSCSEKRTIRNGQSLLNWQIQIYLRDTSLARRAGLRCIYKRHSSSSDRKRIVRRRPSITSARRETLAFLQKSRDSPLRRASGCMGGDLSAVIASASRRPRTSKCLVKAGSRPVQIATPAFQSNPGLPRFLPRSSGILSTILGKSLDTWLSPHKPVSIRQSTYWPISRHYWGSTR